MVYIGTMNAKYFVQVKYIVCLEPRPLVFLVCCFCLYFFLNLCTYKVKRSEIQEINFDVYFDTYF